MVYGLAPDEVRHAAWPLRLTPAEVVDVVDDLGLRCTHVDAYRFFTPAARPLNSLRPTRQTQGDLEQRGCLHATMDLYKWATKLSPFVGSDLVADCFALARDARLLDMRAAPYDLRRARCRGRAGRDGRGARGVRRRPAEPRRAGGPLPGPPARRDGPAAPRAGAGVTALSLPGPARSARWGAATLRAASFLATALGAGLVLASVMAGQALLSDLTPTGGAAAVNAAEAGLLFFGPITGMLALATIVVLALTRPVSMAWPARRRGARATAVGYAVLGLVAAWLLRPLDWAWIGSLVVAAAAIAAWWLLHRAEPSLVDGEWPAAPSRFPPEEPGTAPR